MLQVKVTLLSLEESEGVQMSVSERVMVGGTVLTGRLVSECLGASESARQLAGGRRASGVAARATLRAGPVLPLRHQPP